MKVTALSKVWFITGASRGFGREFTRAALGRGDKVAATARHPESFNDLVDIYGDALLPFRLDVTDRAQVQTAVAATHERFGRLDVVVNNAGYGPIGTVEQINEKQVRDQMETNLFGVFHLMPAVLPILREQRSGHIVQISTISGITAVPLLGGHHASKWTLEGMTASLAQQVTRSGIKVTLIEPGAFSTDPAGSTATWPQTTPVHEQFRNDTCQHLRANPPATGDPQGIGPTILKIIDAEQHPLAHTIKT